MKVNYLKGFIIGSSLPVFALFLYNVSKMKNINYSYENYSLLAPLYFGIMTCFILLLQNKTKMSLRLSVFIISILSSLFVSILITIIKAYNFTKISRWIKQYLIITTFHLFTYNIIIFLLLKNI